MACSHHKHNLECIKQYCKNKYCEIPTTKDIEKKSNKYNINFILVLPWILLTIFLIYNGC